MIAIYLALSALLTIFLSFALGGGNQGAQPAAKKGSSLKVGAIEGKVRLEGASPARQKLIVVKDRDICGRIDHFDQRLIVDKQGGIQNAVVSLTKVRGGRPLSSLGTEFILDQNGCAYLPRVVILPVDKPLTVLNNDGVLHNIHTFGTRNPPVNIAHTKLQKELKMKFAHPERVPVKCDIHGWMSAWVVVVDHPYYSLTDEKGRFTLTDIPPGTYTVSCWNELLGEQTTNATVTVGSVVNVEFTYREQKK